MRALILTLALVTNVGCSTAPLSKPIPPARIDSGSIASARFDPLYLPGAVLMCRPKPLPSTTLPLVAFEFEDGELMVSDRLITAAYDSLGGPRLLVMTATEKGPDGDPIMHALRVSYWDDSPAAGLRLVSPPGTDDRTVPTEALSPAMVAKARDLMVWLWNHRCSPDRIKKQ